MKKYKIVKVRILEYKCIKCDIVWETSLTELKRNDCYIKHSNLIGEIKFLRIETFKKFNKNVK